jgi:glycosyltransferase involved in cell wall biosynthesis
VIAPVACVIPAFEAAATLGPVVAGLREAVPHATLIAVDDGSRDATPDVARAVCDVVLRFPRNRGKGAALRAGIAHAQTLGVSAVLTIDADGQHAPAAAPQLLAALEYADLAIGARARRGTAMPFGRRLTNALASAAMGAIVGTTLEDAQSGYRAVRRTVLDAVHARGDRYEYETDFLIQAGRHGFRIVTVPIPTVYGPPSHFRHIRDSVRIVRTLWRYRDGARR